MQFLLVAIGGAIGATCRHLVGILTLRLFGSGFPWGTITVNIVGSFLMGVIVELIAKRFNASLELRLFLMTGILGGFTTFSSFSLDTAFLWERGQTALALGYVVASVGLSVAALFGGLALVRSIA
ncbi:MAG TPA: fluoride efflux transporter CrcB [Pararhizobium sp.]|nr:fluoride efflux transporter CrcB [Pararhizobium sp.]